MRLLLSKGADARAVNKVGATPADLAARKGHQEIYASLLSWCPRPASSSSTESSALNCVPGDGRLTALDAEQPYQDMPVAPICVEAEVIEDAKSAPAEELTCLLDAELSRLSCSDGGGLSGAVLPPPSPQQRCDARGGGCVQSLNVSHVVFTRRL